MVERLTSNYTDLKKCHKVREKSVLFTENVQNRWLLSAHAVNWYYQNSLFSCVLSALTASPIRLTCFNPTNQFGEGQYKTVVSEGISFLMTFHIEQQRHSYLNQCWKAKQWSIFSTTTDAKGFAMLPAQSLRFRETGGRFWGDASYIIENSLIVIAFCFVLIQTVIVFFHRLRRQFLIFFQDKNWKLSTMFFRFHCLLVPQLIGWK